MKFAISSCWNSHRHEDGYAMLRELADLGFEYVELSHGTRITLVPGILKAVADRVVKVASVHNFCPLPVGVMGSAPNLFEPTAASQRERILWLHQTQKTIEFAQRVQCERIVIHSGRARFLWGDPEKQVDAAFTAEGAIGDGPASADLAKAVQRGLARLNRRKKGFMRRMLESYSLVAEQALAAGVKFGVENREGFSELPLDADMADLMETLAEHAVFGYWHDAGHAELKQRMGVINHREHLQKLQPHLVGFHLHDVSEANRDHEPPGAGVIDWSILADVVQPEHVVVMELSPRLTTEQVRAGRAFLTRTIPALHGL